MSETVAMPKLGFDMAEGTLVRWVKAEGEKVNRGEVLAEIETDKATVEVESPYSGTVLRHLVDTGTIVPVATPIAIIGEPGEAIEAPSAAPTVEKTEKPVVIETAPKATMAEIQGVQTSGRVLATPLAKKVASSASVDLSTVRGSGPNGRITRKDVEAVLNAAPGLQASMPAPLPVAALPTGPDQRIPLDKLRLAIGRRMVEAKQAVPHFYVTHVVNSDAVMQLRQHYNRLLAEDQKLSVNDFIVKAVALALREYPKLNASIDGSDLILHAHVNIGVAVAVEGGLLTVVVKDADVKSIRQISLEVREMASRARAGKVRPDDIEGSTFSISNLGMFDVESFVAIINPPEAAILAVGSVQAVPAVVDGKVAVMQQMRLTVSADHRVTDGAEAARFMQALAKNLEEPVRLVL